MMQCDEARRRWHVRYDGGPADADLAGHLATCAACATYAAEMDQVCGMLDELRAASADVVSHGDTTRHATESARGRPAWWKAGVRLTRLAAMIAIVVLAAWYVRSASDGPPAIEVTKIDAPAYSSGSVPVKVEPSPSRMWLRGESAKKYEAVAVATADPQLVDVYWIFPSSSTASDDGTS